MGRTVREIDWCFKALDENLEHFPNLRLALCGAPPQVLDNLDESIRARIDYLGDLTHLQTRDFAAAIDIGLLPLENTTFNQSRFPIKFFEHLAAGRLLVCSEIGEVGRLASQTAGVIPAGKSEQSWLHTFRDAIQEIAEEKSLSVDPIALADRFSWESISKNILMIYHHQIAKAP
jgi:glycosyltransferase involved in cell wall biosynthesis